MKFNCLILKHLLLLALTAGFYFESALASVGLEYRLDSPGRSMENATIYNQANQGTCYAYAAASYLEAAIRRKYNASFPVSPLALAYNYKHQRLQTISKASQTPSDYSIDSAAPLYVVNTARTTGVCHLLSFKDSIYSDEKSYQEAPSTSMGLLWPLEYIFNCAKTNKCPQAADQIVQYLKSNKVSTSLTLDSSQMKGLMAKSDNPFDFIYSLINEACESQYFKFDIPRLTLMQRQNGKVVEQAEFKHQMRLQLESKNLPVFVNYCLEVVTDRNFRVQNSRCTMHSSLVMGLKEVNKETYFLVQNSWGKSCRNIPHCDSNSGKFWIKDSELLPNIVDYYLSE